MSSLLPQPAFLHWNADPVIFRVPRIEFPFELSILGLLAAAGLFFYLRPKLQSEAAKGGMAGFLGGHPAGGWVLGIGLLVLVQLAAVPLGLGGLEGLGPIEPRWYGLMFACAFLFGYLMGSRLLLAYGFSAEDVDRLLIYVMVSTVVGARLGHVIFYDLEYFLRNPALIPQIWTGGLASHGAAIAIPYAMWLFARRTRGATFLSVADRVVAGVAVGGLFIRLGNFFNSEILGRPTDLPWAIVFERVDMLPRHPTMLYESLWCLVVLAAVLAMHRRFAGRPPQGAMFGVFLIVLFTGRFALEFTKVPQAAFASDWSLNMGQLLSIPFVAAGVWLLARVKTWEPEPEGAAIGSREKKPREKRARRR